LIGEQCCDRWGEFNNWFLFGTKYVPAEFVQWERLNFVSLVTHFSELNFKSRKTVFLIEDVEILNVLNWFEWKDFENYISIFNFCFFSLESWNFASPKSNHGQVWEFPDLFTRRRLQSLFWIKIAFKTMCKTFLKSPNLWKSVVLNRSSVQTFFWHRSKKSTNLNFKL
jgi:hypothetical protein